MQNDRFSADFGPKHWPRRRFWGLFPLLFVAAFLALGFVVQQLWNWILPEILGAKPLDFPKALGLLALCRILFGGFGGGRRSGPRGHLRDKMRQKWHGMTDEERAQFKAKWREKLGKMEGQ